MLLCAPALAQSIRPAGSEFQVNSFTTGNQIVPSLAMDSVGNFVVVWQSNLQGGIVDDVIGQRLTSSGTPLGGEFQVNTFTTGEQDFASVAMTPDGDFVVVWRSDAQDGDSYGIFGKRFDALGVAQGGAFQINTFTTGEQRVPDVAMADDGRFVVAWESVPSQDGGGRGIFGQRFTSAGAPDGAEFQVNTFTTSSQRLPSVGMDADGDFVVAWQSSGQDGGTYGVFAQRFDAYGAAQGSEFQVNTYTLSRQDAPSVALDDAGSFVIAWVDDALDGDNRGIFAQRFDSAGGTLGTELQVNTYTSGSQNAAEVAFDRDSGEFGVFWSGPEGGLASTGVFGQLYDAAGNPVGGEFKVNTFTSGLQSSPSAAIDDNGNFVLAWQSSGNQDGDGHGIFARRYLGPCSESLGLIQDQWYMLALPCEPPAGSRTVLDVFGDDLAAIDYGSTWAVVRWDPTVPEYVQLTLGDELEMGVGYWLKTTQFGQTIDVEGNNPDYTVEAGSDVVAVGGGHTSPQMVGAAGDCTDAGLTDGRFNLMGFPFHAEVLLAGAMVLEDGTERTFPQAEAANLVSDQIWTWSGAAYQAADTCTPGLEAKLSKWDAFWVDVCDQSATLEVRTPAERVDIACSGPSPPGAPEETGVAGGEAERLRHGPGAPGPGERGGGPPEDESWYLRLVATSGKMTDPGNVLGELPDSVAGWDRHDLVELPPFGSAWLTVVFPHGDWGAQASDWYTSDYHGPKDRREWGFEVRSDRPRAVTLSWEIEGAEKVTEKLLRRMELVDEATGTRVPAEAGSYTFTMTTSEHPFGWRDARGGGRR